jgi:hypothetical protein
MSVAKEASRLLSTNAKTPFIVVQRLQWREEEEALPSGSIRVRDSLTFTFPPSSFLIYYGHSIYKAVQPPGSFSYLPLFKKDEILTGIYLYASKLTCKYCSNKVP